MRNVDEYIDALPGTQKELMETVRLLILENIPGIVEKFSYKLPVYHYYGMLLFLHRNTDGIYIAFMRGRDLISEFPQLEMKDRAIVASVTLRNKKDIKEKQIKQLIVAAAAWNEEAKKMKIAFFKTPLKKKNK